MRTTALMLSVGLCCLTGAAIAAGEGENAKPATPPAAAAPASPAPAAKKIDWAKMNLSQRKKYMKSTVLPEMKKLFVAFDKKKYSNMSCQTCHGDKASEVKFKMPNAQLPKLPQPTDRAGFMALQQKKPEAAKFMGTQVKPTIASLLGLAEWSPTNAEGVGCYNCHTKEGGDMGGAKPPAAAPAAAPAPAAPKPGGW